MIYSPMGNPILRITHYDDDTERVRCIRKSDKRVFDCDVSGLKADGGIKEIQNVIYHIVSESINDWPRLCLFGRHWRTGMRLTRKKAWLLIRDGFSKFSVKNEITKFGLCYAVKQLTYGGKISLLMCHKMMRDIFSARPKRGTISGYYWPLGKTGARSRVRAINQILKKM